MVTAVSRGQPSTESSPKPRANLLRGAATMAVWLVVLEGAALLAGYLVVGHHGGGPIQHWDNTVERWWVTHRGGLVTTSKVLATLGDPLALAGISALLSALLVTVSRRVVGLAPLFGYAGGEALVLVTREFIARHRPPTADYPALFAVRGVHETSYSYPSDHATAAVAVLVCFFGVLCLIWKLWSPWLLGPIAGAAGATSRLLLGVNWFSDVAIGMGLGLIWAIVVTVALRRVALNVWPFRSSFDESPSDRGVHSWPGNRAAYASWPGAALTTSWGDRGAGGRGAGGVGGGAGDPTPAEGIPAV